MYLNRIWSRTAVRTLVVPALAIALVSVTRAFAADSQSGFSDSSLVSKMAVAAVVGLISLAVMIPKRDWAAVGSHLPRAALLGRLFRFKRGGDANRANAPLPAPPASPANENAYQPTCRFCGTVLKRSLIDLGAQPLSNCYLQPAQLSGPEPTWPLHAMVCESCLLVQIDANEAPERIFSADYAYFSSYSESWLKHAADYAEKMIERLQLDAKSRVVEVASNDGYLLQNFVRRGIPSLGVEPANNVAQAAIEKGIPTRICFLNTATAAELAREGQQADLLIGNNVLAHNPSLNDFVQALRIMLKPSGTLTMEFPHVLRLIAEIQFDTIYHEHFSYFSLLAVQKIFAAHQLTIYDVDVLPTHGGSLRIYAARTERGMEISPNVTALLQEERTAGLDKLETYDQFAERVRKLKRNLIRFLIDAKDEGKTVVGYGAAAKGNTLLNYCGARADILDYVADANPYKQGAFLPGTRIPIVAPEKIKETKPDYVLVLPWNLKDEIMMQHSYIREWGGKFVLPVPELRVN